MPQAKHAYTTPKVPLPQSLPPAARRKVEAAIQAHMAAYEAMVAFLDQADGDADLEPSLGEQLVITQSGQNVLLLDAEGDEHDGREPEDEAADEDLRGIL